MVDYRNLGRETADGGRIFSPWELDGIEALAGRIASYNNVKDKNSVSERWQVVFDARAFGKHLNVALPKPGTQDGAVIIKKSSATMGNAPYYDSRHLDPIREPINALVVELKACQQEHATPSNFSSPMPEPQIRDVLSIHSHNIHTFPGDEFTMFIPHAEDLADGLYKLGMEDLIPSMYVGQDGALTKGYVVASDSIDQLKAFLEEHGIGTPTANGRVEVATRAAAQVQTATLSTS